MSGYKRWRLERICSGDWARLSQTLKICRTIVKNDLAIDVKVQPAG